MERFRLINEAYEYLSNPEIINDSSDVNIQDDHYSNFKTGFPDFQDYLDSLFGYEYSPKNYDGYNNEQFEDETINIDNDEFFKSIKEQSIKDKLIKLTADAFQREVFGTPTFIVNNKTFWGQDRLEYALEEINNN